MEGSSRSGAVAAIVAELSYMSSEDLTFIIEVATRHLRRATAVANNNNANVNATWATTAATAASLSQPKTSRPQVTNFTEQYVQSFCNTPGCACLYFYMGEADYQAVSRNTKYVKNILFFHAPNN